VSEKLAQAGVDLGLLVAVQFGGEKALVAVQLVDAKAQPQSQDVLVQEVDPTSAKAIEEVRKSTVRVLEKSGHHLGGHVHPAVVPGDASIALVAASGTPIEPRADRSFVVPPGRYELRAARSGYAPASTEVNVERFGDSSVALSLEPSSGSLL